jgi:hypothetical protein
MSRLVDLRRTFRRFRNWASGSAAPDRHQLFDIDERCLPLAVDWLEAVLRKS